MDAQIRIKGVAMAADPQVLLRAYLQPAAAHDVQPDQGRPGADDHEVRTDVGSDEGGVDHPWL
jgi:hypothetical protein